MTAAIKRLNNRQRKKKYLGQFQVFGFEVAARFRTAPTAAQTDALLNDFIRMSDAQGLEFAGGVYDNFDGFVTSAQRYGKVDESHREVVRAWLAAHPLLDGVSAGPLRDDWHSWTV